MAQTNRRALIIVMSPITRDPRVLRQIEWLKSEGWAVDTVGPAGHHVPGVESHFGTGNPPRWTLSPLGSAALYGLLPHSAKFRILLGNLIPGEVKRLIAANEYGLILFNDHHFLPWLRDKRVFTPEVIQRGVHLDIHEYVRPRVPRDSLWRYFAAPYYDWIRTFIGDPHLSTRSTVASGISELYAKEFGIPQMAIVRSAPAFVEQEPSVVDPNSIELVYHGAANDLRGIPEMLEAMERVSPRFRLTLILVGEIEKISEYRRRVVDKGLRVNFVDPVPVEQIAQHINSYDVEVMFFPPHNRNLEFALPNKLFEALQGRLALLMGESSMMTEIVSAYSNGVVAVGWSPDNLADSIESLTAENVTVMKSNSDRAARAISAESERTAFFESIEKDRS
ncbi:capsular polysaccharide synthesis enzyme CAP5I [Leifsonia rubra CMS 76R]|nr:capsular polysaccharide synthesis enzyme CAP5I [Leifsonia rubra CMS 76R]